MERPIGPGNAGAFTLLSAATRRTTAVRRLVLVPLAWTGCAAIVLLFAVPYLWMLGSSLRAQEETFRFVYPFQWHTLVPLNPTLAAYGDVFGRLGFGRAMVNSLVVAVAVAGLGLLVNSLAGFAFARMPLPGRELLFLMALSTSFIPFEAIVVPMYLVVKELGMTNSYAGLILPWVVNPFGILLMREAFAEVPQDLVDAGAVDGASWRRIYWSLMVPLVRPTLVSFALVQFLWTWDSFFWPLVVAQDPALRVVQVAIATFSIESSTRWDWIFAASSAATFPILCLFVLAQRYFVRGIATTGLK
jgi:ABC-type glycerol-3-phosphate transport system permease component